MQSFLPCLDFAETAQLLDYQRLGKMRVECWQILNTLLGKNNAWKNHPIMRMWRGSEGYLAEYGLAICAEWIKRDYKDTMTERIRPFLSLNHFRPSWLGDEKFHASHRAALLFKNFDFYSKFNWTEMPELNYVWPINNIL